MKKMCKLMSGVLLAGMLLVGCAEKPPEELLIADIQTATIYLREDGSVQSSYVEEFDKAYYDVAELRTFMEEMIGNYNRENGTDKVTLTDLLVSGGKVYAILTYQDLGTYADFNYDARAEQPMMMAEAVSGTDAESRYGTESFYQKNSLKGMVTGSEVLNAKKQNVVVIQGPIQVRTSGDIQYYTGGSLEGDRTLELAEGVESVIIYKK